MKRLLVLCFVLASSVFANAQQFDNYSNFHLVNGEVFWQNVYQCPGMNADSVFKLVMTSTKSDATFNFINDNGNEVTFDLTDKLMEREGNKYSGRVILEMKDEKYRLTFSTMTSRAGERRIATTRIIGGMVAASMIHERDYFNDWSTDRDKKYFRNGKLQYLTKLNNQFLAAFDFKKHSASNFLKKDW